MDPNQYVVDTRLFPLPALGWRELPECGLKNTARMQYELFEHERQRLKAQFKADLLTEVGLSGHPKADMAFEYANQYAGYEKDLSYNDSLLVRLRELALLILD